MPRKAATPSLADQSSAPGGVLAVDRALTLLSAFRSGDAALGLSDLATRTGLYKSTALRLLTSLEHARMVQRGDDGRWTPGAEVARLAALRTASSPLQALLLPLMHGLVKDTRESVAFHVRHGTQRICLLRVDSPQALRDHVRVGDVLPLQRGSGGRVLLAFGSTRPPGGEVYRSIRANGFAYLDGDRVPDLSGVSAPVWQADGTLAGALTLTAPSQRMQTRFVPLLVCAARDATERLGGDVSRYANHAHACDQRTPKGGATRHVARREFNRP